MDYWIEQNNFKVGIQDVRVTKDRDKTYFRLHYKQQYAIRTKNENPEKAKLSLYVDSFYIGSWILRPGQDAIFLRPNMTKFVFYNTETVVKCVLELGKPLTDWADIAEEEEKFKSLDEKNMQPEIATGNFDSESTCTITLNLKQLPKKYKQNYHR